MLKGSCNLFGRGYILLHNLKVNRVEEKNFCILRISLIFQSALFLLWPYHTQTNQSHRLAHLGKYVHGWADQAKPNKQKWPYKKIGH